MKKIQILACLCACTLLLSGCGKDEDKSSEPQNDVSSSVASTPAVEDNTSSSVADTSTGADSVASEVETSSDAEAQKMTAQEQFAFDFAENIRSGDYASALQKLGIDTTFVTADDLSWYIQRIDLADAVGLTEPFVLESTTGERVDGTVTLKSGDTNAEIHVLMNENNEFYVDIGDFAFPWTLTGTPACDICLNGVQIDKEKYTDEVSGDIVIPNICAREVELTITGTKFNPLPIKLTPEPDTPILPVFTVSDEDRDAFVPEMVKAANLVFETFEKDPESFENFCTVFYMGKDNYNEPDIRVVYDGLHQEYVEDDSSTRHTDQRILSYNWTDSTFYGSGKSLIIVSPDEFQVFGNWNKTATNGFFGAHTRDGEYLQGFTLQDDGTLKVASLDPANNIFTTLMPI